MTIIAETTRTQTGPVPLLSDEQAGQYLRQGWCAAPGFFSPAEMTRIAAWTDELKARPEEPGVQMVYAEPSLTDPAARLIQRIENFCPFHADFDQLVHGRLKAAVEVLLAAPAVMFKDKINFKMAGGAGFEPHQDQQAGWSRYAPLFVTALVCIDRATLENGCLEMADAPRFAGMIGEEWAPLTAEQMASFPLIAVPSEPGDVLFFDSYAPHASKPNRTDGDRRILYITYNAEADGDHRALYFAEKRANFPPDVERAPGAEYKFRV
jgi:2-aminoethylphosphonate dioxygenase